MSWHHRNWRAHKLVPGDRSTDVFMILRRLLATWRDDPERLAVAVTAYEMLGYTMAPFEIEYPYHVQGRTPPEKIWSRDHAIEIVNAALHRRNRRVLRARAYGLLMALVELASDAEELRLHNAQVDACVIECRFLTPAERSQRLREREAELDDAVPTRATPG